MGREDHRHPGRAHRRSRARDGGDAHDGQHRLVAAAQPPWRAAVLGAGDAGLHAGPDRPAGRRLRRGLRPGQPDGQRASAHIPARRCRRAPTRCRDFIPVARFTDMLLNPGGKISYNGREIAYPDIRLVYWAGGNPFHHHQDLNRLRVAWRKPETIVVQRAVLDAGRAAWPTSCCPPPPASSATTSATAAASRFLIAMKKAREPVGEARDDYCDLLRARPPPGRRRRSTPKAATPWQWLNHLYEQARVKSAEAGRRPSRRSTISGRPASPRPRARTARR